MVPKLGPSRLGKGLRRILCFYIPVAGLGTGCAATAITVPPPEPAVERLAQLAPYTVKLSVNAPSTPLALGHQFLLVVIPFGSISLTEPESALHRAVSTELAIAGFRVVGVDSKNTVPTVTITPLELRVSAFDLLLTRRVSASVKLGITVASPAQAGAELHYEVSGESASFERFGFSPELSQAFGAALTEAVRGLVSALQSSRRFRYDAGDPNSAGLPPPRPIIRRAL